MQIEECRPSVAEKALADAILVGIELGQMQVIDRIVRASARTLAHQAELTLTIDQLDEIVSQSYIALQRALASEATYPDFDGDDSNWIMMTVNYYHETIKRSVMNVT